MPDIYHYIGSDLTASANGDILTTDSLTLSQQSVLRRLLTNAGDYIWHPEYGAGLPALIGQPIDIAAVKSLILSQIFLEETVMKNPAPIINVTAIDNGMFVELQYTEADSKQSSVLRFDIKK